MEQPVTRPAASTATSAIAVCMLMPAPIQQSGLDGFKWPNLSCGSFQIVHRTKMLAIGVPAESTAGLKRGFSSADEQVCASRSA